jgi:hypothetical protein
MEYSLIVEGAISFRRGKGVVSNFERDFLSHNANSGRLGIERMRN